MVNGQQQIVHFSKELASKLNVSVRTIQNISKDMNIGIRNVHTVFFTPDHIDLIREVVNYRKNRRHIDKKLH